MFMKAELFGLVLNPIDTIAETSIGVGHKRISIALSVKAIKWFYIICIGTSNKISLIDKETS